MGTDPAFLFYPGDYLRDTQCLSEPVQVAYDRIMCEHMRNICISQEQLNFFTKRLNDEQKSELGHVLKKIPGGFQIGWVAESIEKRRNYSDSRRKNREGKSPKSKNISKSYVPHMENENVIENEDKNEYGSFDEKFKNAFDDYTLETYKMTFRDKDIKTELQEFLTKCNSAKEDYHRRDVSGLRLGFQYQLKNSKSYINGTSKKQQSDNAVRDSVEQHYRQKLAERGLSGTPNKKSG